MDPESGCRENKFHGKNNHLILILPIVYMYQVILRLLLRCIFGYSLAVSNFFFMQPPSDPTAVCLEMKIYVHIKYQE